MTMNQIRSMSIEQRKDSLKELSIKQLAEYNATKFEGENKEKVHTYSSVGGYWEAWLKFCCETLGIEFHRKKAERTWIKKEVQMEIMRRFGAEWCKTHTYTGTDFDRLPECSPQYKAR